MLICCRCTDDPALLTRAAALCPLERRQKAERLLGKGKAASLAAGLLLRHSLFLQGFFDPTLSVDAKGRPFIEGDPVFFSLSHSEDYAACAVSRYPVGVDIQRVVPVRERVIRRFCTGEEQEWLASQPDQTTAAVLLWALKESYLKASGELTETVFQTTFLIENHQQITGPQGWQFTLFDEIKGYALALCEKQ